MELSTAQQFQLEVRQYAETHNALLSEASALVQSGRGPEAINLYRTCEQSLQAFQEKWDAEVLKGDPSFASWWRQYVVQQKSSLMSAEGLALRWMGRLEEAGALFEQAQALTPAETYEHAFLLSALGGIRFDRQEFTEAEELLHRSHLEYAAVASGAEKTEPESAPQFWQASAQALADSAYAALARGDYQGFEKSLDEAVSFAGQHNLLELADKLWLRQASQLLAVDASGETIQRVKAEQKERRKRSRDPEFRFEAAQLLAEFYREQGELELARSELEDARESAPQHKRWSTLRQLADICESQGDLQAAEQYGLDALALARQLGQPQAILATQRALACFYAGHNPAESERYLSEVRASGERDEIKNALLARAAAYFKQKQFELALRDIDEAERAMPEDSGVLLARLAALRGMNAREEALQAAKNCAAALRQQLRRSGADWKAGFELLGAVHESAALLAAELGRPEEAFAWAENGKALRLRSRFAQPSDAPQAAEIDYTALRERLRADSARLIFFSVTNRGTLALLCDAELDRPRPFFLDLTDEALSDLLPSRESEVWNRLVFEAVGPLSEKLAPALREAVSGRDGGTLYIVPDSQLYFLPFAALDVGDGSKLVDHCALVYLPCAAMLASSRAPHEGGEPRTCLAAGADGKDQFSFSEQAAQIAALAWDSSECLREARAQDVLDKAPHFSVLHLQCHGRMEASMAGTRSASFLKLADRGLMAKDVYGLSLTTELVFLNACLSGRFKSRVEGEVGGFWEAFLHAGACSIIVTLAYVHPDSAQRLALSFYRHWLDGKSSAEALREAQLEVRREKPEPSDWATHILIGVG